MKHLPERVSPLLALAAFVALAVPGLRAQAAAATSSAAPAKEDDAVLQALVDEQQRSMALQLKDLEKPYFIQYSLDDTRDAEIGAAFGAVEHSDERHARLLGTSVRVGSPQLDNTNYSGDSGFMFSFGGGYASMPIEDDPIALRSAVWAATDDAYKSAVETLTKKRAYMADKKLEDRPADFTAAPPSQQLEPAAKLSIDRAAWEQRLAEITLRFRQHPSIQESSASLSANATNRYLVNSEGTRLRTTTRRATLEIDASTQAEDGMRIADQLRYVANTPDELPPVEKIVADIDALVQRLDQLGKAPILDHYSGPVLFDGPAAGSVFRTLLAGGLAARPEPVGQQRAGLETGKSLEKKLGTRILPDSFHVWDDPAVERVGDKLLLGHYAFDDEGVAASKVDLVVGGKLQALCLAREPTKKSSGSNGHGRSASAMGRPQADIGNLFVEDSKGLSADDLKQALIKAASDAGLEYGIRVGASKTSGGNDRASMMAFFMAMQSGQTKLTDPLYAWKVFVSDGHEELIRGCEFAPADDTALKHILAAGKQGSVGESTGGRMGFAMSMFGGGGANSSVISPAVLFEELELSKIEQENDKLPYLPMPQLRKGS